MLRDKTPFFFFLSSLLYPSLHRQTSFDFDGLDVCISIMFLLLLFSGFPPLFPFSLSSPPFVQHTQRVRHDDDTNYVTHECFVCVLYKCACLVSQVVVVFVCLSPACFPFVVFSLSVAANNNNNNNPLDPKSARTIFPI